MGLAPDSASMLIMEVGRELRFYEDTLAVIGLLYVGKITVSLSLSLYRGFKEHIFPKLSPNKESILLYGSWAVVTGASEGVGRAFSEELARRGMNIVLLDRDITKLNIASAEIEQDTGVDTRIVEVNFYDDFIINDNLLQVLKTIDVGILINAFQLSSSSPAAFSSSNIEYINSMLNANIKSLTNITYLILKKMTQRKSGLVLNISAFSGLYPIPFISTYSASKAYVEFFSRALSMEYTKSNIKIQIVTPGLIKSDDDPSEHPISCLFPTMNTFVRNTIDSLGVSNHTTGSWLFSLEFWFLKRVPKFLLQMVVYEIMNSAC